MGMSARLGIVLGLLLVAAAGGLYLSGHAIVWLLGLKIPVRWALWWQYYQALALPAYQPFALRIKLAGAAGFGLALVLWLPLAALVLRSAPRRALYGDARFARRRDLSRHHVLDDTPTGIIAACRFGGRLVKVAGKHVLLASPTRSGKGVSTVMPNALAWPHSMVLFDVKQEAFEQTAGYRAGLGAVYLFDPLSERYRSHRWNPLHYVSLDPLKRSSDIENIAGSLYPEVPHQDPFWMHASRSAFQAACEYLFDLYMSIDEKDFAKRSSSYPTLGEVYRLLSASENPRQKKQEAFRTLLEEGWLGKKAREGLSNLVNLSEDTFSSVVASAQGPLRMFANPVVDAATSGNDFDLRDLRRAVQSIYVGVAPAKLVEAKVMLNLFFEQAIKLNGTRLPEQDKTLKYQCLFLLDEFTSIGKLEIIPSAIGWLAGYGVRILIVIQSLSQLDAVYGAESARSITGNMGAQVLFGPREQRDAEEFSKMLGETTVYHRQRTRNYGGSGGHSHTEVAERRPLMTADEVKALDVRKAIVLIEGVGYPILGDKIFYYKDRQFKGRVLPAPEVPRLRLEEYG